MEHQKSISSAVITASVNAGDDFHAAALQGPGIRLTTAAPMGAATELCQDGILCMLIQPSLSHFFSHDLASSLFALFQSKRTDSNVKQYLQGTLSIY